MSYDEINKLAEEIASQYNPDNISPFPYQNIQDAKDDLKIYVVDLPEGVSGVTAYDKENKLFNIYICRTKPQTRQHFTIAHELGHYFLHGDVIQQEELHIDGEGQLDGENMLFRLDNAIATRIETEANNFAASLIMPKNLVIKAWNTLKSIEECAKVFNVSTAAMSIRLERLKLLT